MAPETSGTPELQVGWGKVVARLRGHAVVWAVLGSLAISVVIGVTVRAAEKSSEGHDQIMRAVDLQACLNAVQAEGRLQEMRKELGQVAQMGGDVQQIMRLRYCPWMKPDKSKSN